MVILTGARQTGKTTLVRSPRLAAGRRYVSLDDFAVLDTARRDPLALAAGDRPMTFDEIQRAPELLSAIKMEVDDDRRPGRFLCTGSANLLLMKQVTESLAGRAVYLDIPPLTWAELEQRPFGSILDAALAAPSADRLVAKIARASRPIHRLALPEAVIRGGYPVAALTDDAATRGRWFEGYIATYLERDLRVLSAIDDLVSFRRFMQAAALRNGSLLNVAQLAQDAGIPPSTASRYLSLLDVSCIIRRIPAFTVNRGKRLAKSLRLVWIDAGLAAHLAGISDARPLAESRHWGSWLEGWIAHHLATWSSLRIPRPDLSYWRTSAGQEVDFVLETGQALLPIEVKATARPRGEDIRSLESFLGLYPEARLGIVACDCREPHALSRRVAAVPVETLLLG